MSRVGHGRGRCRARSRTRSWRRRAPSTRTRPAGWSWGPLRRPPAGEALRYEALRNRAASPYRYEIHPDDLFRVTVATDDADEVFWAIVHSHVKSPAVPSPTDIGLAFYPDALYILVSLADDEADPVTGEPSLRAWRIVDGEREVAGSRSPWRPASDAARDRSGRAAVEPLDRGRLAWLAFGIVAFGGGTLLGWNADLLDALVPPPALIRAALVGAQRRRGAGAARARDAPSRGGSRHSLAGARHPRPGDARPGRPLRLPGGRGVLAGAGWLLGHPLPFIVALVIAGVDVLETSFLLVVVTLRAGASLSEHDPEVTPVRDYPPRIALARRPARRDVTARSRSARRRVDRHPGR